MALLMSESKFEQFKFNFFNHFRSSLGACISRNMGRMSVPTADMSLSDVIEKTLKFFDFFTILGQLSVPVSRKIVVVGLY